MNLVSKVKNCGVFENSRFLCVGNKMFNSLNICFFISLKANSFIQFIFSFKNFTINLTFERISTWVILICSLNLHFLSNTLSQMSHLKGSHHEQLRYAFSIYIFFQIFYHKSHWTFHKYLSWMWSGNY